MYRATPLGSTPLPIFRHKEGINIFTWTQVGKNIDFVKDGKSAFEFNLTNQQIQPNAARQEDSTNNPKSNNYVLILLFTVS